VGSTAFSEDADPEDVVPSCAATTLWHAKNPGGTVVKTMKPVVKPVNTVVSWRFTVPRTWKRGTYHFYV
jgi:hypothetical protein